MKFEMDARFMDRNTKLGVDRFLASKGIDLDRPYKIVPGPNKNLLSVVQAPPKPPPKKPAVKKKK